MPTRPQLEDRRALHRLLPVIEEKLGVLGMLKPDKSGDRSPAEIAERRATLVRVFVLLGRSQAAVVDYIRDVLGQPMTRQALARQLSSAALVPEADRLITKKLRRQDIKARRARAETTQHAA